MASSTNTPRSREVTQYSAPTIRAHVLLCWLALLLIRIIENHTGHTWHHLRDHLQELHVGLFEGPAGSSVSAPTSLSPTATSSPR